MFDSNARRLRMRHIALAAGLLMALAGCSSGGGGGGGAVACAEPASSSSTSQITGAVCAPGGALAFNAPTGLKRFFAEFFGRNAIAALPGMTPVSGTTVKLIEIDGAGTQVGLDIATATTAADGSFTLNVPGGFTPAPRFVIRANGSTTNLDRLVSDFSSQDVDPASHATKTLVLGQLAGGNIQNLQRFQVEELGNGIANAVNNVDSSGVMTAIDLVNLLTAEAQAEEELSSAIGNLTATGSISGTVTDSLGTPLANIKIIVRDFNQWVTRAEAHTDANGQYSLNVAARDYIVGALNFTAASMAGSEWWTCDDVAVGHACGSANEFNAVKTTVAAGAIVRNFKLEPGARVQGTITSAMTGTPLPGVQLAVRDFTNDQPVAFQYAQPDGTVRVNLRPGTYSVGTRNMTFLPFANGLYNGPATGGTVAGGGGANVSEATPMVLAAGTTTTVNFPLIEGGIVRGTVTDGTTPTTNVVAGLSVRFYASTAADATGAFVEAVRTNNVGKYRMWVRPGTYKVRARGQTVSTTVIGFSSGPLPPFVGFAAAVGRATATLLGPGAVPLSQVKVFINDNTANTNFVGNEATNSDGTVEVYAALGDYHITYQVDNGSTTTGTAIEDGTANPTAAQLQVAPVVHFDPATPIALGSLGTVNLPAGGEIRGVVTLGSVPTGNLLVQVRIGGAGGGGSRFASTRTSKDGSYSLSVPALTYSRVCALVVGTVNSCPTAGTSVAGQYAAANNGNPITVTANQSNTFDIAIP